MFLLLDYMNNSAVQFFYVTELKIHFKPLIQLFYQKPFPIVRRSW